MAIVTPAFSTIAPAYALALSRSSTAFTKRQRDSAARATARFTVGRRRRDDIPRAIDVAGLERPPDNRHLRGHRRDLVDDVRRHDCDPRPGVDQRAQLPRRHGSGTDDQDAPPFELEEHGKYCHQPPARVRP